MSPFTFGIPRMVVYGLIAAMVSCKGPKKNNDAGGTNSANSNSANSPSVQVPPLDQEAVNRISNTWGVIRLNDGTFRQGILVEAGRSLNGKLDYLILAADPADEKRIDFAIGLAKTEFFSGVRRGQLPNGLSLSASVLPSGWKDSIATPRYASR